MNRKNRKKLVLVVLMLLQIFIISIPVFADTTSVDSVVELSKNSSEINVIVAHSNMASNGVKVLSYNAKEGVLAFSNKKYATLEVDVKQNFMQTALNATRKSHLGKQVKNKMYNFIADQDSTVSSAVKYLQSDVTADFAEAKLWFAPFSGPISTILGLLCIFIFVFMGGSIAFDLAYLVLPGFQLILERGEEHRRPFGVSNSAWKTNKQVEDEKCQEGVLSIYLKKRIPEIFIIAICLGYLISGKIYSLMVYFIDAFSAI